MQVSQAWLIHGNHVSGLPQSPAPSHSVLMVPQDEHNETDKFLGIFTQSRFGAAVP